MRPPRSTPLTSPNVTFFYRRIIPILWYGMLAALFLAGLFKVLNAGGISNLPFLAVPLFMGLISYRFLKKLTMNLADEVFDAGDALIVRRGSREERIALADIENVNYIPYMSPPQVTLTLRRPSGFGLNRVFYALPDRARGF
jgi:hypothetical protein